MVGFATEARTTVSDSRRRQQRRRFDLFWKLVIYWRSIRQKVWSPGGDEIDLCAVRLFLIIPACYGAGLLSHDRRFPRCQ